MASQHMSTHVQCATLQDVPANVCDGGPLFQLGHVVFEPNAWEMIPARYLTQALELHSCGVFGELEDYEILNNSRNVGRFEKYVQGESVYPGCIYSRWNPPDYPYFMVFSGFSPDLNTRISMGVDH